MKRQCEGRLSRWLAEPCSRNATVEHKGKWYCGWHSPQAKERKREKWQAQRVAENAERDRRVKRKEAIRAILSKASTDPANRDWKAFTDAGGTLDQWWKDL